MKLTVILLTVSMLQVSASGVAQNVTYTSKDASLEQVFNAIKKQTGYVFFYRNDDLSKSKPVTIQLKDVPLKTALEKILEGQPLSFRIIGETVVIKQKEMGDNLEPLTKKMEIESRQLDISGRVTDESGKPLEGVSVVVKGTSRGTSTNKMGVYSLNEISEDAVLVFSMVGFRIEQVPVKGRSIINVRMNMSIIEEKGVTLFHTGYQTISRERATGSYDIIDPQYLQHPTTNIASRLVGQVAGLQAKMDADGNPTFQIRGLSTLYAGTLSQAQVNSDPLIVVDGFAIEGGFNSINPNDVENITVLKDAAASSIWGARAANGVIVITTKMSQRSTPLKIELNAFTRIGKKFGLDYANPKASPQETIDYEKLTSGKQWFSSINSGSLSNYYNVYPPVATIINEYNLGFITEEEMNSQIANFDGLNNKQQIYDNLIANPVNNQINLRLSGGSKDMSNSLSLLYETNQSNFKGNNSTRYMLNYQSLARISKWLDFNIVAMVQFNENHNNGVSLGDISDMAPYQMLLDKDGNYLNIPQYYWPVMERYVPMSLFPYPDWGYNPIQEMKNRDIKNNVLDLRLQGGFTFHLLKGLTFESKLQFEKLSSDDRSLYNEQTFMVRQSINQASSWDQATNAITANLPLGSMLSQDKSDVQSYDFRNQLNFNRIIAHHHEINFVGGTEILSRVIKGNSYPTAYGYNDQTLTVGIFPNGPGGRAGTLRDWLGRSESFGYTNSFSESNDRFFSLFANLSYSYKRKYTISGSARTDASNLITDDPAYRYAPFWSVGGLWNVKSEKFMRAVGWVNSLKLRATYGYNGNVDRSTSFRPLISMSSTPNVYTQQLTASISSYGNPTLRWEKTGTFNVGMDFDLFRHKLFGKIDVYRKYGRDLIARIAIPAINGTDRQKLNNAAMVNKGIELTLGTTVRLKKSDIIWNGSVLLFYNDNKITNLFLTDYRPGLLTAGNVNSYVEGYNANTYWAYEYLGVRGSDKQPIFGGPDKSEFAMSAIPTGDGRTYLLNMGKRVAPYGFSFNSNFKIYDFDLSFVLTGKFGYVFRRSTFNYSQFSPNDKLEEVVNGDPNKIVPLPLNDLEPLFYRWKNNIPYMSYLATNASHLRMQEVNLTYNLTHRLLRKLNFDGRISVYAQGNNLFVILANKYGEDPEYPKGSLRPMPQYTFGARFNF